MREQQSETSSETLTKDDRAALHTARGPGTQKYTGRGALCLGEGLGFARGSGSGEWLLVSCDGWKEGSRKLGGQMPGQVCTGELTAHSGCRRYLGGGGRCGELRLRPAECGSPHLPPVSCRQSHARANTKLKLGSSCPPNIFSALQPKREHRTA